MFGSSLSLAPIIKNKAKINVYCKSQLLTLTLKRVNVFFFFFFQNLSTEKFPLKQKFNKGKGKVGALSSNVKDLALNTCAELFACRLLDWNSDTF